MRRKTPIITQVDPNIFGSGLFPDLHPVLTQLWEKAEGVRFVNGKMLQHNRPVLIFQLASNVYTVTGIGQMQTDDGTRYVYAVQGTTVQKWYGPPSTVVGTFADWSQHDSGNTLATYYDFTRWGNWMVICGDRKSGAPLIDKQTSVVTLPLGNFPPILMMKKFDFLLGFGMGTSGTEISWCNQGNIEDWVQGAGRTAGTLRLEELDTPIRAAASLGSSIAVYGVDQMILLNYVGAPFYFGQKFGLDGIGAVNKMAVCSDGRMNYGVSRNGVWRTDGVSFEYIDEGYLREYLQNNVNWLQAGKIFAFKNDASGCFEFHFPLGTDLIVTEAWSYDPRTSGWSKCRAGTAAAERRILEAPIMGQPFGTVYLLDYSPGAEIGRVSVRTKPMSIQGTHTDAYVDEIQLLAEQAEGVEYRVGVAEDINGVYVYSDWYTLTTGMTTQVLNVGSAPLPTGTYFVLELRNPAVAFLNLQGFVLYGEMDGRNRDMA